MTRFIPAAARREMARDKKKILVPDLIRQLRQKEKELRQAGFAHRADAVKSQIKQLEGKQ